MRVFSGIVAPLKPLNLFPSYFLRIYPIPTPTLIDCVTSRAGGTLLSPPSLNSGGQVQLVSLLRQLRRHRLSGTTPTTPQFTWTEEFTPSPCLALLSEPDESALHPSHSFFCGPKLPVFSLHLALFKGSEGYTPSFSPKQH